jgi:glucosamine 6-phosphate synthetase-like amidotransferase/phosphosugar isomerase protein
MCGLAGMAGNGIINTDLKVFKDLLYVASLRGEDSTGVMIANTHKPKGSVSYAIEKEKVPSPEFIKKHSDKGGFLSSPGIANLFMGHARWATIGDKTLGNAHPFDTPKLVGMHNGTLDGNWDYMYDRSGKTDSELMFEDMSSKGILAILQTMSKHSAYAVTIYDKKSRKLFIARNNQRGLYVGFNKVAGVMYWSSEFYMLHMAADRHNVKIESFYTKPDLLYEIDIDQIKRGNTAPWVTTPIVYETKKLTISSKYEGVTSGSGWRQNAQGMWEYSYE